jgi:hypothetical protein
MRRFVRNCPTTDFLCLAVRIIETAVIGKILAPDRREGRKFFIDFRIRL